MNERDTAVASIVVVCITGYLMEQSYPFVEPICSFKWLFQYR